jgi:hypothetical protein
MCLASGNVAISRHTQDCWLEIGVFEMAFEQVLKTGLNTPVGNEIVWFEKNYLRLVISVNPTSNKWGQASQNGLSGRGAGVGSEVIIRCCSLA